MDREEWLARRKKVVTSTEMAALFGLSEWETPFGLWHRKKNGIERAFKETDRVYFGRKLEPVIAEAYAERTGVVVEPDNEFREKDGIGASYDFKAWRSAGVDEPLEIKTADPLIFKDKFIHDGDIVLEFPFVYELQFQTQLLLHHRDQMAIAVLVGGNTFYHAVRTSDEKVQAAIKEKVAEFWASTEPPPIDYERDTATLDALYADVYQDKISPTSELDAVAAEYLEVKKQENALAERKLILKNTMKEIIGNACGVDAEKYKITRSEIRETSYTVNRSRHTRFLVKGKE